MATIAAGTGAVIAAYIAVKAFDEYAATNRLAARVQLRHTEHIINEREFGDPDCATFFVDVPDGTPPAEHCRILIMLLTKDPDIVNVTSARQLYDMIWNTAASVSKDPKEIHRLRKAYLHAELYLYHLHEAYDYREEEIISDEEWETWAGVTEKVVKHPLMLVALIVAHENGFLTRRFAKELVDRIQHSPSAAPVVRYFYAEMLDPDWLKAFPNPEENRDR